MAFQSERLNEHDVVIGSAVLDANGVGSAFTTWLMPCVASDHLLFRVKGILGSRARAQRAGAAAVRA